MLKINKKILSLVIGNNYDQNYTFLVSYSVICGVFIAIFENLFGNSEVMEPKYNHIYN